MHELSTMVKLVNMAIEEASASDASHIMSMTVKVGEMTGILPRYLHRYFPQATAGTIAEGAQLQIIEVPVRIRCLDCGTEYEPTKVPGRRCPQCESVKGKILSGRELTLESLEVI